MFRVQGLNFRSLARPSEPPEYVEEWPVNLNGIWDLKPYYFGPWPLGLQKDQKSWVLEFSRKSHLLTETLHRSKILMWLLLQIESRYAPLNFKPQDRTPNPSHALPASTSLGTEMTKSAEVDASAARIAGIVVFSRRTSSTPDAVCSGSWLMQKRLWNF